MNQLLYLCLVDDHGDWNPSGVESCACSRISWILWRQGSCVHFAGTMPSPIFDGAPQEEKSPIGTWSTLFPPTDAPGCKVPSWCEGNCCMSMHAVTETLTMLQQSLLMCTSKIDSMCSFCGTMYIAFCFYTMVTNRSSVESYPTKPNVFHNTLCLWMHCVGDSSWSETWEPVFERQLGCEGWRFWTCNDSRGWRRKEKVTLVTERAAKKKKTWLSCRCLKGKYNCPYSAPIFFL